jgi:putative ABC transport system permease protein
VRDASIALTWARRELRTGLAGFWVFLACLALGVGAIAGVGSVSQSIQDALQRDARALAGGDAIVSTVYEPPAPELLEFLERDTAEMSRGIEMRVMAGGTDAGGRRLAELKAVDAAYPIYGEAQLLPAMPLEEALGQRDGVWGAVAEQSLFDLLGLRVGDLISVGDQAYRLRAALSKEPDRSTGLANFGPRMMVSEESVAGTGLLLPGSLVQYKYRLKLPPSEDPKDWVDKVRALYPDANWRLTPATAAARGLERMVERLTLFLTLVGLTALLIGGIGIANAVQSFLAAKSATIAMLKCVGAPSRVIFLTYALQIAALAGVGIAIGLALGGLAPFILAALLESLLPVTLEPQFYGKSLLIGVAFGAITTAAFALWPLLRARRIPAVQLFRDQLAPAAGWPTRAEGAAIGALFALLGAIAVATAADKVFAIWFVGGVSAAFVLFFAAAMGLEALARRLLRTNLARWRPSLRLALANLCRPGAPTASVVLSLGFGVTVLVAVAAIEANLDRSLQDELPAAAPTFFFIDIQPQQFGDFRKTVQNVQGSAEISHAPMLRARITRVNGEAADPANFPKDVRWALQSERGLTYRSAPPETGEIVSGDWWPADYQGPPLISFSAELAQGLGVGVGDTLTFNILGREVEARIANLRDVDFRSLRIEFTTIFAPGAIENAPHTVLATTQTPPEQASELVRAVGERFPNITAIRVKEALEAVDLLVGQIGNAIRVIAAVGLIAGVLVLASAVAAGQEMRKRDAVVLKVLGATRPTVLGTYLWEFGALGFGTVAIAAMIGAIAAYVVTTEVMDMPWAIPLQAVLLTAPVALAVTMVAGFAGVWQALGQKPAPLLRNP